MAASPAGIAVTAGQEIHLHSNRHTAMTTGDTVPGNGQSLVASALHRIVLFARKAGLRLFAAKGKIEIQAQTDDIEIIAQKVLRVISAGQHRDCGSRGGGQCRQQLSAAQCERH